MRLIRFLRRLRLTVYLPWTTEHHFGIGYHYRVGGTKEPILDGGERGVAQVEIWIAHREWDDPENDPRKGPIA